MIEHLTVTDAYRPARLVEGKEWTIVYWVRHPQTGLWARQREKVNHIKEVRIRRQWSRQRVDDLNLKLRIGWNPLRTGETAKSITLVEAALAAFISSKVRDKLEKDSMRTYRSLCGILLEWLRERQMHTLAISAINEGHARLFMDDCYMRRTLSNRTYNNYLQFYVSLWNWLKDERYVGSNVFAGLKRKKVSKEAKSFRPPTEHERGQIKAYLEREQPRFLTFCLLCFYMGIRPKEAFMLRPRDFHLAAGAIVVDHSVAKNDRTQGVAIPHNLMPHLLALNMEAQHPDHYVFSSGFEPGPLLRDSRVSGKAWDRMRQRIGLAKEVTMYQVKHAGAVAMARAGLGAVDLMNHLRHHDLAMTTIYTTQSDMDGVRAVIDKEVKF
jgi:integrase